MSGVGGRVGIVRVGRVADLDEGNSSIGLFGIGVPDITIFFWRVEISRTPFT
jgi:hypothetical protein